MELKDTQLAIVIIGFLALCYIVVSYLLGNVSDPIVFGAFTAVAGLAGFEAGREK